MAERKLWTRDELILALNLYLKLPYGKMHARTPEIIHLANLINRTPDSIAMRLVNFASVDPYHQKRGIVGLKGGLKQVEPIWNEFINNKDELLGKCAITGIDIPDLLLASHILPWSKNEAERLNPENGICLSPLYDRAFDKGYIGINEKFEILLSKELKGKSKEKYHQKFFSSLTGLKIIMPKKYYPKKEFLQFHLDQIFKG